MPANKRIPIKEVALAAGVSTQTISRVINNRPDVSPETRQRVQAAIAELGYKPSRAAKALRGSSSSIGAVGAGLENYGPSRTLMGINLTAKQRDYSIVLELVQDPEHMDIEPILDRLFTSHVGGIVWGVPHIGDNIRAIAEYARTAEIPVVFTDTAPDPQLSMVTVDNLAGGHLATEHLIDQGHEKIALITGPLGYFSARERVRGWQQAMTAHGLDADESLIAEGDWTALSGVTALKQILKSRPDVTAVFASNDQIALGVIHCATHMGLRIPHDLAVIGYDNIPEAAFFSPPLSSVHQNVVELGALAVNEVVRLIDIKRLTGALEPSAKSLQPELVIRESSVLPGSAGPAQG